MGLSGFEALTLQASSLNNLSDVVELQRGSSSAVYTGKLQHRDGAVVVKAYFKNVLKGWELRNVRREQEILTSLCKESVNGIVQLIGTCEDDEHIFLVFEPCWRGDCFKLMLQQENGYFPEAVVCEKVVAPLLTVLQDLHGRAIVHRDVKPENIFYTLDHQLRLGDFGLAVRAAADEEPATRVGTLDYMAPEVLLRATPDEATCATQQQHEASASGHDNRVDIWAVGVLVYELLTGRPPFEVEDLKETERLILTSEPAPLTSTQASAQCADFIAQCLRKDPTTRPSVKELRQHPWLARAARHPSVSLTVDVAPASDGEESPVEADCIAVVSCGSFGCLPICGFGSLAGSKANSKDSFTDMRGADAFAMPVTIVTTVPAAPLKQAWQTPQQIAAPAAAVKKSPGKSRFAS